MDTNHKNERENAQKLQAAQINIALGIFLLFFGVVVLFAISHAESFVGQMTNLAAGVLISLIGGGMIVMALIKKKSLQ